MSTARMATPIETDASCDRLRRILKDAHLWGSVVGIALQPISTATGNVGFGIALTTALPRLPAVRVELASLVRRGWMRCLLAWLAWSWLSLAWSPDPGFGVEQLKATRVLLWIPILWPLRAAWRTLVAALLTGTTIMVILQASQILSGVPSSRFGPGAGLTMPTQTGLWAAVALSFWLIIAVSASVRTALLTVPIAAFTGVGLVWSATRASALGLLAELVFTNIVLALTCRGWLARAALRCLIGAAILGTPAIFAGSHLQGKVTQAISETVQTLKGEQGGMTSEIRLAMWRASLDGWRESPIIGVGLGGTPSIMRTTTITTPAVDLKTVRMIHSTYIMALVDTGLVGLGLFLGFAALLFGDTLRGLRGQPLLVASFGALVVWFVAAAFDGYQQSGGFLSVGAILIPLALADLREDAQPTGNSSPTA